jgi:PAS domain S-box-containing protein
LPERALLSPTPPGSELPPPPDPAEHHLPAEILAEARAEGGADRSGERAWVYWTLFFILLAGSLLIQALPGQGSPAVHTVMEVLATVLAFVVGALALVRFYSRKQATFLFIGTGFLGAAVLDLNHALITSDWLIGIRGDVNPEDLFAWSWTSERVFLSLFLFVSLLGWRQELRDDTGDGVPEASVYGTALLLTLANLFFFEWVPLTRSHFAGLAVSRPAEFLPGAFFLVAFFGYLAKGSWRRDAFEHWLLIFLLISTMTHVGFMSLSRARFDPMFDAAHALKIASYLAILTGLLYSVYLTFRREAQVLGALTGANEALAREVDVRARTEQAVKEGRSRLQDFLDNANDLIQSVAPDGKVLYVNSAWKRVLGYTDEQLARLKLRELVHPAHRENLEEEFERVLDGGDARRFNVEYLAADGRTVILSGSVQAQRVRGEPVATQGIFRDVTEQRLAERQLAESRANLAALVENTGDSIWSIDRQHRLITFNSAFSLAMEARSGLEPSKGQSPRQTFPREDLPWYEDVYARALSGERHVALRTDEVDGQTRYFELYANPIQGEGGITGAVFFGKDVTPRVRAEEALRIAKEEAEAANKAKSDFLANMSHELRTPLNSVIGFTNILRKNKDEHLTEKDLGFLNRVLANGKHLLELINEVLDLAKVEAGRMELVIEEVDLGDLVTETVMQLEGQAKVKEGDVSLVAAVPGGIATVETDSAKLKQVIINLVGNALKFTHEGTVTVRVDVGPDGRTPTAIAVQDTGIGIPDDRLEAIFEAFQQAEAGTSRKYGGTGLGLAISRSICLLMGYDLIVESEVGTGSTFSIVMGERARRAERRREVPEGAAAFTAATEEAADPAEEGGGSEGERTGAEANGRRPRRAVASSAARLRDFQVLVVDDEKDSRVLMAHYLEDFGCEVIQAQSGEDGLAAARLHDPDLITLDLMMPGMSGWEVLRRLKQDPELRHIPVVVVSIVAGEGRGRLLGAVDLVTKPFEREDLLRVLWRNLVRRRGGRILVADDDPVIRESLGSFLGRLGLETVMAEDGKEALDAIRTDAPDAVILDLAMPGMDGMTFLGKLRENPLHMGLPVLVLTGMEVTRRQHEELGDLASAVVHKGVAMQDELEEILGSYFRLADGEAAPR